MFTCSAYPRCGFREPTPLRLFHRSLVQAVRQDQRGNRYFMVNERQEIPRRHLGMGRLEVPERLVEEIGKAKAQSGQYIANLATPEVMNQDAAVVELAD